MAAALAVAGLEVVDAFLLEVPFTAILLALVLLGAAARLRRPGQGPVKVIAAALVVQLLLVAAFGIFGSDLSTAEAVVAALLGVTSIAGLLLAYREIQAARLRH